MADPYVGEIRMFGGNFAPVNWAFCNGQLMPIAENEALFQLIGTTYGGDGETTFALPDLRGRLPVHQGTGMGLSTRQLGQTGGVESVFLTAAQIPAHSHTVYAAKDGTRTTDPTNALLSSGEADVYTLNQESTVSMGTTLAPNAGNQPHDNLMPYLCVSFIISLFGIFPPQN